MYNIWLKILIQIGVHCTCIFTYIVLDIQSFYIQQIVVFGILIFACSQRNVVFCSEISNIIFYKQLTLSVVDSLKIQIL